MSEPPLPAGKLSAALLRGLLDAHRRDAADVLLPPAVGEDAGVIAIKGGALVAATDPITLTGQEIGGHAVVINANDVAVMGVRPQWFLAVLLLPLGTTEAEVTALFEDMGQALDRLDVALVGGHTEITSAVTQPVVVGQMLGYREDGAFLRTGSVAAGDVVLQVGPAPIEGAAVLANEAGDRLAGIAPEVLAAAQAAIDDPGISVVEPALRATTLGATALHDPTEGGLSAGLYEMAEASGLALLVDRGAALWFAPGEAICAALEADPWGVLASGTLLAAFPENAVSAAREALEAAGYATASIARAEAGSGIRTRDGGPLPRYEQDELSRILDGPQG
ncbi:MAG: AIR synthase related protein [Alphaproteobacteria bacterium]|nr:AIR synthase related protein [Alphaproteobacteria bacterium]